MIADGVVDADQFDVALIGGDGHHAFFFLVAQQVEIVCLSRKMLVVTAKSSKRYFFKVFRYFSYKEVFYSLRLTDKW